MLLEAVGEASGDTESLTLEKLSSFECGVSNERNYVRPLKPSGAAIEVSGAATVAPIAAAFGQPAAPMAPQSLTVESSVPCPGLEEIHDALWRISDDQAIETARTLSNETNLELFRWQQARNRIFLAARVPPRTEYGGVQIIESSKFKWLTLRELRELDKIRYTSMPEFSAIVNARMIVSTPYVAVSQGANSASVILQFATFVFVAYFCLNVKAAIASHALLRQGTMFATMTRGRFGQTFFVALLFLPASAAIYLAVRMAGIAQIIGATAAAATFLLTVLTFVSIFRVSYSTSRNRSA